MSTSPSTPYKTQLVIPETPSQHKPLSRSSFWGCLGSRQVVPANPFMRTNIIVYNPTSDTFQGSLKISLPGFPDAYDIKVLPEGFWGTISAIHSHAFSVKIIPEDEDSLFLKKMLTVPQWNTSDTEDYSTKTAPIVLETRKKTTFHL